MVDRLFGGSQRSKPSKPISIADASKRLARQAVDICEAVRNKRICSLHLAGTGSFLERIIVDQDELNTAFPKTSGKWVSINEISTILSVKWEVASSLADFGFFGSARDRRYSECYVRSFKKGYRKNSEIAREIGMSPKRLLEMAENLEIPSAIAPPLIRQAYFTNEDAALLEMLAGIGPDKWQAAFDLIPQYH